MNKLGYDAMALGEGDLLKLGLPTLQHRVEEADFAILSANAVLASTDQLLLEPYMIREIGDYRLAIIGLTGPVTTTEVITRDPLETVQEMVTTLKDQADVIILLSHAGLSTNHQIATNIPEIDLVISGGGSGVTSGPMLTADGRMTLHPDTPTPGHAGRYIGIGNWRFDAQGQRIDYHWQRLALGPEIADDPAILSWAQQYPKE
jgi:hypothetical protein